jgi:hypothetical protein
LQIYERWKCTSKSCKNFRGGTSGYCYVHEGKHVEFDRVDGNTWDRAILKGNATIEEPPTSLLESMIKKNARFNQPAPRRGAASVQGPTYHNYFQFGDLLEKAARIRRDITNGGTASSPISSPPRNNSPVRQDIPVTNNEVSLEKFFEDILEKEQDEGIQVDLLSARDKMINQRIKVKYIRKLPAHAWAKLELDIGIQMIICDHAKGSLYR